MSNYAYEVLILIYYMKIWRDVLGTIRKIFLIC